MAADGLLGEGLRPDEGGLLPNCRRHDTRASTTRGRWGAGPTEQERDRQGDSYNRASSGCQTTAFAKEPCENVRMDENDKPRSALEIAMARLKQRDADSGVVDQTTTDEQKAAIAEARNVHAAKLAELQILQRSKL